MKHIYQAPNAELMYLSRDVITTSATEPYAIDLDWDFTQYQEAGISDLNI